MNHSKRCFWALVALTLFIIWCPGRVLADSRGDEITVDDIEFSEPFEVTANIMEIDHGKRMLIVAEKKIYVVDRIIGAEPIKSILTNAEGRPISFDTLESGGGVTVIGMMLPDGRVIAEELIQSNQ